MRRWIIGSIGGAALLTLIALVIALPATAQPGVRDRSQAQLTPLTIEDARDRVDGYLSERGFTDLSTGDVVAFSNHFAVVVVDASGVGAFELLVSSDGTLVHPAPAMMWNTQYDLMGFMPQEMMGRAQAGNGMLHGSMATGMAGNADHSSHHAGATMMDNETNHGQMPSMGDMMSGGQTMMMDPASCGLMMGVATTGSQLAQPMTADDAITAVQEWLDQQANGLTASSVFSFPGYFTIGATQEGAVVELISVQAATGAIWPHTWHGDVIQ